ncbi:hypothetical protein HAX54_023598, partial [Datura stramonium]|nr:hypothetical protein [Datura stramonium]
DLKFLFLVEVGDHFWLCESSSASPRQCGNVGPRRPFHRAGSGGPRACCSSWEGRASRLVVRTCFFRAAPSLMLVLLLLHVAGCAEVLAPRAGVAVHYFFALYLA